MLPTAMINAIQNAGITVAKELNCDVFSIPFSHEEAEHLLFALRKEGLIIEEKQPLEMIHVDAVKEGFEKIFSGLFPKDLAKSMSAKLISIMQKRMREVK